MYLLLNSFDTFTIDKWIERVTKEKLKLDPFFSNYQNYYQKLDIRRKLLSFEES